MEILAVPTSNKNTEAGDGEDDCWVLEANVVGSGCFDVWFGVSIASDLDSMFWVRLCNKSHRTFDTVLCVLVHLL
ncbi:hypothetical protein Tco_0586027 [Tanacetum coccineum]